MAVTIDAIQLNIKQGSDTASSSLDRLAASIANLKGAAKGGVGGLGTLSKQLTTFSSALASVNGLNKISNIITSLSQLNSMQKPTGFASTMNQLKKLPEIAKNMKSLDMRSFYKQISQLTRIMKPLATEMQQIGNGFGMLSARMQRVLTTNARLTSSNQRLNASYKNTGMSIRNFGMRMLSVMASMRMVVSGIDSLIQKSNAYQENLNLFTVSMGEYTDQALQYAEAVNKGLGIDVSEWIRYQAVFQNMTEGFGIASDKAEIMSRNLTQMGYDLGSVFNVNFDTAMEKLESAISGQPRPMREWGFDLSEASLKAVALSQGIEKNVETMSQMEKAQLRYIYLWQNMEKLGLSGDFARTIDAPANSLRVLSNQLGILAREAGNVLIPALNAILPYLIAIAQLAGEAFKALAALFGFKITEIDYSGLAKAEVGAISDEFDDVSSSAGGAGKAIDKVKGKLAGFDQINLITSQTSSGGGGRGGGGGASGGGSPINLDLPDNSTWLDDKLSKNIENIKNAMKDWIPIIELVGITLLGVLGAVAIGKLISNLSKLGGAGLTGFSAVKAGIAGFLATFLTSAAAVYSNTLDVLRGNKSAADGVRDALLLILPVVIAVGFALNSLLGPIGWVIAGVGAIVGAVAGYAMAVDTYAQEAYETTDTYKLMADNIAASQKVIEDSEDALGKVADHMQTMQDLDAEWASIHNLVDEIFELSDKTNKSDEDMALLRMKVDLLNSMGLEDLHVEIDETTEKVIQTKEEIEGVIKNLEKQAYMAALQKVLESEYEELIKASMNYNAETERYKQNVEAQAKADGKLTAIMDRMREVATDLLGPQIAQSLNYADLINLVGTFCPELKQLIKEYEHTTEAVNTSEQALDSSAEAVTAIQGNIASYKDDLIDLQNEEGDWSTKSIQNIGSVKTASELIGSDLGAGVKQGIKDSARSVLDETRALATDTMDTFKQETGVNSPSTKFMEIGKYCVEGFAQGLTRNTPIINTAMNTLTLTIDRKAGHLIKDQTFVDLGKKIIAAICLGLANHTNTLITAVSKLGIKIGETMKGYLTNPNIKDIGTKIVAQMSLGLVNNSKSFVTAIDTFMGKIFSTMTGKLNGDTSVYNAFKRFFNKSIDLLQGFINRIRNAVNDLMRKWAVNMNSATYNKTTGKMSTNNISYITVPHFASGGFVDNGQLFLARESGAEMVGAVGNRTAVANNDQIVQGIANGVMNAIINTGIVGSIQSIDKSARVTASKDDAPVFAPSAEAGRWIARSMSLYRKAGGVV